MQSLLPFNTFAVPVTTGATASLDPNIDWSNTALFTALVPNLAPVFTNGTDKLYQVVILYLQVENHHQ